MSLAVAHRKAAVGGFDSAMVLSDQPDPGMRMLPLVKGDHPLAYAYVRGYLPVAHRTWSAAIPAIAYIVGRRPRKQAG